MLATVFLKTVPEFGGELAGTQGPDGALGSLHTDESSYLLSSVAACHSYASQVSRPGTHSWPFAGSALHPGVWHCQHDKVLHAIRPG